MSVEKPIAIRWTYACNDVRFARKDNPSAWVTTDQVNGAMFMSYPVFEFIPGTAEKEPRRYGDMVFDIDTGDRAVSDAIAIIAHFEGVYGVEPDQWRIYLSGKKGVHLELADSILGTEQGHVMLPMGYKRLAKDVEGALNITLDTSMYNRGTGKPYRQPNVMRDTGTCKRQIEHEALFEITTEEEYRAACSSPGGTWQPANTERNALLAAKLEQYISEAEEHQEKLSSNPPLTDDEVDRLALNRPACVSFLANVQDAQGTGATYNDVAIQLTAYAVSAKVSEQDFINGCHPFIFNYPSSSLKTPQMREDNCRARFRTMSAHEYQFSCGGILALRFKGFSCDDCKCKTVRPLGSVVTAEDTDAVSISLDLPEHIANPGGLISLGMQGLVKAGSPSIPQFALPVVMSVLANALAGKIIYNRVWPNIYNVKVGTTSLGKSDTDDIMRTAMGEYVLDHQFYGPTGFASGPALMRSMVDNPMVLVTLDECTNLFKRYMHSDPISDGIRDTLLELYSNSGGRIRRVYSDSKKSIDVERPCVSLIGNATGVVFDAIKSEDFDTGTMQRFDFWAYDGPALERDDGEVDFTMINQFAEAVAKIYASTPPIDGNLAMSSRIPLNIGADDQCKQALKAWSKQIIAEANAASGDGEKGIVSRKYNLAIKYALIHMASSRPVESLYEPMTCADLHYGQDVATMLARWKIETLTQRVSQGEFHRQCQDFKAAIISAIKNGKRPTFKVLAHRRPALKNWRMKDSHEVISVLEKRGEIVLDESKRPTAYYLVKSSSPDC